MITYHTNDQQKVYIKKILDRDKTIQENKYIPDHKNITQFLILGSGGSGTSLLRGLLNAHSKLDVMFENMQQDKWDIFVKAANKKGLIWGNKMPVQKMNSNKIFDKQIEDFIENYFIIWLVRRPAHFDMKLGVKFRDQWGRINSIYWKMKDKHPDKIINISFEDLVLWPASELTRICNFLGIIYENKMLEGTRETGHRSYRHSNFLIEKVFK